jgi:hypothetical protein
MKKPNEVEQVMQGIIQDLHLPQTILLEQFE